MRVWYIHPGYLDQKRLIAAHNEVHMLRTCVLRKVSWGPTRKLNHSLHYAKSVHDDTVEEIHLRKGGVEVKIHHTPFEIIDLEPSYTDTNFTPSKEELRIDVEQLREKWTAECYYYGTGRLDLRKLEEEFDLPRGKSPEEGEEIKTAIRGLVRLHKEWFDEFRVAYPKSRMRDRMQVFVREVLKGKTLEAKPRKPTVLQVLGITR